MLVLVGSPLCPAGCAGCGASAWRVLVLGSSSLPAPPSSCEVRGSARALEQDLCTAHMTGWPDTPLSLEQTPDAVQQTAHIHASLLGQTASGAAATYVRLQWPKATV